MTTHLKEMDAKSKCKDMDLEKLRKLSLNVCLRLKSRNSRWERFLTKRSNLKATKFHTLEACIIDHLKIPYQIEESTHG